MSTGLPYSFWGVGRRKAGDDRSLASLVMTFSLALVMTFSLALVMTFSLALVMTLGSAV